MKRHGASRRKWTLVNKGHFLPEEAEQLKVLRRLDYYELRIMIRQRRSLWNRFVADSERYGWSRSTADRKWRDRVKFWYVDEDFIKMKESRQIRLGAWTFSPQLDVHDVWFWFDYVRSTLPVERQYLRRHRGAQYVSPAERKERARKEARKQTEEQSNSRMMDRIFQQAVNEPQRDMMLTRLARHHGFTNVSVYRTALARGYRKQGEL